MDGRFKILVVDDIKENIYSLRLLIEENFDVDIYSALSAHEAIEILIETKIDLILTDVQMPEIDGFEFAQYIKEIETLKNIPIIFITGIYDKDEYKNKGYDLGGIEYITKPINNHLLISKLKIYIDLYNGIKESNKQLDKTQDLLVHSSKMASMGEMIGLISHQLKQPLNVLSLYCNDIDLTYKFDEINDDYMKYFAENTKKQISYMDSTISDFLNFFSTNKKKIIFSISSTISKAQDILKSKITKINAVFNNNLDEKLEVLGMETEFLQVLINIISNSLDAFDERKIENPQIDIKLFSQNEKIILEIEDNAGGVDESVMTKILDPYYTTKENGTGIGLYMVKLIIENSFLGDLKIINSKNGLKFIISF